MSASNLLPTHLINAKAHFDSLITPMGTFYYGVVRDVNLEDHQRQPGSSSGDP